MSVLLITRAPTRDRPQFRLNLATAKFSAAVPIASSVCTVITAKSFRPTFPVNRAPPMIGTLSPLSVRPMRRLKKSSAYRLNGFADPTRNFPEFSRKKSRFSGKKRAKRVRFTCSSSTSACAKSVLTVRSRFKPEESPYFMSSPTSCCQSLLCSPDASVLLPPAVTNGVTLRSIPLLSSCIPSSTPALLTLVMVNSLDMGAQKACSFLPPMFRIMFMPHTC